jgi:hypothetical protein
MAWPGGDRPGGVRAAAIFLRQDPGQDLGPNAQLWRRLHTALIHELGCVAADRLAHRRARDRERSARSS